MKKLLGNVVLICLGWASALALAELLMRAFPELITSEVRVNPPARRVKALVDETYAVTKRELPFIERDDLTSAGAMYR